LSRPAVHGYSCGKLVADAALSLAVPAAPDRAEDAEDDPQLDEIDLDDPDIDWSDSDADLEEVADA
jgi:hypothetical protein